MRYMLKLSRVSKQLLSISGMRRGAHKSNAIKLKENLVSTVGLTIDTDK